MKPYTFSVEMTVMAEDPVKAYLTIGDAFAKPVSDNGITWTTSAWAGDDRLVEGDEYSRWFMENLADIVTSASKDETDGS